MLRVSLNPTIVFQKVMSKESNSSGRPTQKQQLEIQETLRKYFEKGISASSTSHRTGINIKTVCKYFEEWIEQIRKINDMDFLKRIKLEREHYLAVLDQQLLKLYEIQDDMEKQSIPPEKTWKSQIIQSTHYKERMNLVNMVCQIMNKKFELLSKKPIQKISDISKN